MSLCIGYFFKSFFFFTSVSMGFINKNLHFSVEFIQILSVGWRKRPIYIHTWCYQIFCLVTTAMFNPDQLHLLTLHSQFLLIKYDPQRSWPGVIYNWLQHKFDSSVLKGWWVMQLMKRPCWLHCNHTSRRTIPLRFMWELG